MARNIFIDESTRDADDDWEEEQDEDELNDEENDESVSSNKTCTSALDSAKDDLSVTNLGAMDVSDRGYSIYEAVAWPTETHLMIKATLVQTKLSVHLPLQALRKPPRRQYPQFMAFHSDSQEALKHPVRLSGPSSSAVSRHPVYPCPALLYPFPTSICTLGGLGLRDRTMECKHLDASALLLGSRSLEWTRIQSGTYRNDIGLIVDVTENVATTYVIPRIGDPDAPRRRGSKRFFTSKDVRRYIRSGRDFSYENRLGFDRWTLGRCHTRVFKCGFEVLSLSAGYSGPGELPTVEEFQLFYTNHCPHLDTQEGLKLLERTSRLLLPPVSPGERCEIVGGPLFGSVCTVTSLSHSDQELDVAILGGSGASVAACLLRRFFRPGDLVEARLGFHVGTVAIRRRGPGCNSDSTRRFEVTFLKDFLVFHNEAFTPMGDDAHRWLSVGHINRAPNGVQIGDMCEVIQGPEAGAKELDVADKGTRALVEVDGQYRLIIAPTKDLKLLTEYMPLTGADVSRLVGSHPHLSTIIPVQTMLDDLPDRFTRFIGYRVTVIGTHHLKGSQGWLRAVSMDVAVCELDHSAVFSKATHQLHVDKIGVIGASTSRKWVKLEDAIRPNRRGITMVYEKEGAPQRPLMRARTPPAPPLPSAVPGIRLGSRSPENQQVASFQNGLNGFLPWLQHCLHQVCWSSWKIRSSCSMEIPTYGVSRSLTAPRHPALFTGSKGCLVFPIEHPTEVPPDRMLPLRPSEVKRPYEALVVHRRHEFFGRVVLGRIEGNSGWRTKIWCFTGVYDYRLAAFHHSLEEYNEGRMNGGHRKIRETKECSKAPLESCRDTIRTTRHGQLGLGDLDERYEEDKGRRTSGETAPTINQTKWEVKGPKGELAPKALTAIPSGVVVPYKGVDISELTEHALGDGLPLATSMKRYAHCSASTLTAPIFCQIWRPIQRPLNFVFDRQNGGPIWTARKPCKGRRETGYKCIDDGTLDNVQFAGSLPGSEGAEIWISGCGRGNGEGEAAWF
ncbi:hypothetical protein BKA70DRAFT_1236611 [Coprinopsis sp. MPI-PUGE-AT-0042]|nr:hypothetical protein BKA70DRAFT_1236611 [Coprinopsis sp. MPI-PUGE-AT-0042]